MKINAFNLGMPKLWLPPKLLLVMKLVIILMTGLLLQVNASGFAQRITINKKDASLKYIFNEIRKQTGYDVLWQTIQIQQVKNIDVSFRDETLETVLKQALAASGLSYAIKDKTVVIQKTDKTFFDRLVGYLKAIDIHGLVVDEKGLPLPGASVKVKGSNKVTKTNGRGEFSLEQVEENAVLSVSYLGYQTKDVAVKGESNLRITLAESQEKLEAVVVVGYGTTKRKDLVGTVATIGGDDMRKQVATNFTQALAGRAAGVQVSRPNGNPGAGASIRIRGLSTASGVNDPLFVIDGIPVQLFNGGGTDAARSTPANGLMDPLAGIDMNDVENIEVLKDATATAIYGSRAANGVVIVTTKRGRAGEQPVFSFNYDVSMDRQNKFLDALSGPEYVKFMTETYEKAGVPIEAAGFPGTANTDWQREVIQKGLIQNLNLSVMGASKDGNTNYGFSTGLTDQKGVLINTGFKRYSLRANVESKFFDLLKIGTNLNYSLSKQTGGSSSMYTNYGAANYRPDVPVRNPDGSYANDGLSDNPVATRMATDINESQRLLASVYAELEIIPGLKARSSLSYDVNHNAGFLYTPSWLLASINANQKGSRTDRNFEYTNRIFDNTLSFTKAFDKHHIDAVAGASWTLNRSNFSNVSSINFPNDNVLNNLGSAGMVNGYSSGGESSGLESFFLRANYNYDGKYYLTVSGRADNSTKFGPENQWGYFPSVGLAWRFSQENFMKGLSFIDDAKLRLTRGKTGTSAFGSFGFLTLFNTGYFYNGINGLRANPDDGQPNPDIRWEGTTQTDAALELSFLKSRLKTTVNFYRKYTEGMITGPSIPSSNGYSFQNKNIGDVSNQGWEFTVSAIPVNTDKFTWISDFNISFNKNKVEKTYGTALYGTILLTEGLPLNGIRGYRTNGLYQDQGEIDALNAKARLATGNPSAFYQTALTAPGDVRFVDLNGDGRIDTKDRSILGYSQNPKYFGGWNNTFRYGQLELSTLFQFDVGSKVSREQNNDVFGGYFTNVSSLVLTGWTPENPNTQQPRNVINGPAQNVDTNTDRFIEDTSFLRLKNVQLSYLLNNALLKKMHIQQLRLFAGMTNLFTWTKYKGLDPEVNSENTFTDHGRDTATYPTTQSITFGVNLKF